MKITLAKKPETKLQDKGFSYFVEMFQKYTGIKITRTIIVNGPNNDLIAQYELDTESLSEEQEEKINKLGYKICE